jgi:citrate lyase subunit beta/citryl-CoA lyase
METPNPQPSQLRRSLLFVPGAESRKLEKAREAGADTLLLDLEDAVAPDRKTDARANVAAALRAGTFGSTETAVRINAPGTPYFEADLEAIIAAGGRTILLPKSESAEQIVEVTKTIASLEQRQPAPGAATKLLLLVETPAGIANALVLGHATPRVDALCFGHADFSLSMGLTEADAARGIIYHARCNLLIAAKACAVAPIDCVHLAVKDEQAFREDAELGMHLGFEGKLCIHPRQVEITNAVYAPSQEQIDYARRVIEGYERAQTDGRGVFTLDGKMIDAPLVAVQQRVLERARRAGVTS